MPYKDITYDNGFTERIYYNTTPSEEAELFTNMSGVKSFPSANHRAALKERRLLKDQEYPRNGDG